MGLTEAFEKGTKGGLNGCEELEKRLKALNPELDAIVNVIRSSGLFKKVELLRLDHQFNYALNLTSLSLQKTTVHFVLEGVLHNTFRLTDPREYFHSGPPKSRTVGANGREIAEELVIQAAYNLQMENFPVDTAEEDVVAEQPPVAAPAPAEQTVVAAPPAPATAPATTETTAAPPATVVKTDPKTWPAPAGPKPASGA